MKEILGFYQQKLGQFGGGDPRSVGWRDRESQELRFRVLAEIMPLEGMSVLDLGCGLGDLATFLGRRQGKIASYAGWDICAPMVDECRRRFPELRFEVVDILSLPDEPLFDVVLGSGIFALPLEDESFYERVLMKMWALCRRGIAFNMISNYVDYYEDYLKYHSPEQVFGFCKTNMSRFVCLRHDYMKFEFTVYVYKRDG